MVTRYDLTRASAAWPKNEGASWPINEEIIFARPYVSGWGLLQMISHTNWRWKAAKVVNPLQRALL